MNIFLLLRTLPRKTHDIIIYCMPTHPRPWSQVRNHNSYLTKLSAGCEPFIAGARRLLFWIRRPEVPLPGPAH